MKPPKCMRYSALALSSHTAQRMLKSVLAGLLFFVAAPELLAQYTITSYTIGGGGGRSTGGGYAVRGTIGQPDAGWQSGGVYVLDGGFWNVAESADALPELRIQPAGRSVLIAWPDPSTGFRLQHSPDMTAPVWSDVRSTPTIVGAEKQILLPLQPGSHFFRLRQDEAR